MQSLKYLTILGNFSFLSSFTFPSLISLEVSIIKGPPKPLLGHIIPHRLETLRTNNVAIDLEDSGRINPLRNIRVFEAVESIIVCETHDKFSLPKVQTLRIERTTINSTKEPHGYPDISLVLNTHESMESVHSLTFVYIDITTAAIKTLKMLKGLSKLTIKRCRFQGDAFDLFCHMLKRHNRGTTFPSLQFLNFNDLLVYTYKGEYFTKMDGNQVFSDIK
jgi:hypothetical protein